jgi:hypothetical protein
MENVSRQEPVILITITAFMKPGLGELRWFPWCLRLSRFKKFLLVH